MATKRVQLLSFAFEESFTTGILADMLIESSDDYSRFIIHDYDERYIDGIFCIKTNHNESIYDFQKGTFDRVVVERIECAKFSIDLDYGAMLVSGTNRIITQLITALGTALSNRVAIDKSDISISRIIDNGIPGYYIRPKKAKLSEIPIEYGLLATCSLSFAQEEIRSSFLKKHRESIIQLVISVFKSIPNQPNRDPDDHELVCTVYRSGTVTLSINDDTFFDEQREFLYALWNINGRLK